MRTITDYVGATRTATINTPWDAADLPTNADSRYEIHEIMHTGTAQGFPSTQQIQLDASASSENDFYNSFEIEILSGPGEGQSRTIVSYVAALEDNVLHVVYNNRSSNPDIAVNNEDGNSTPTLLEDARPGTTLAFTFNFALSGRMTAERASDLKNVFARDASGEVNWHDLVETIYNESSARQVLFRGDDFLTPRVTRDQLEINGGGSLEGLSIDDTSARWTRLDNLTRTTAAYKANLMIDGELRRVDDFLDVFDSIMDALQVHNVTLGEPRAEGEDPVPGSPPIDSPRLMRLRAPATEPEKQALQTAFGVDPAITPAHPLFELFRDLDDRRSIDALYQSWFSQAAVVDAPDMSAHPGFELLTPDTEVKPAETVLEWIGPMTTDEYNDLRITISPANVVMQSEDGTDITGDLFDPTNTTLTLSPDAPDEDGLFDGMRLDITSGTGLGQRRRIRFYDGVSQTATLESAWDVLPDSSSSYSIFGFIHGGTARNGSVDKIQLDTDAEIVNDHYNGMEIEIVAGTGLKQVRTISDYVGSDRTATLSKSWDITPDDTSEFAIRGPVPNGTGQAEAATNPAVTLNFTDETLNTDFAGKRIAVFSDEPDAVPQIRTIRSYSIPGESGPTGDAFIDLSWDDLNIATFSILATEDDDTEAMKKAFELLAHRARTRNDDALDVADVIGQFDPTNITEDLDDEATFPTLIIKRNALRYHGLMTPAEAEGVVGAFTRETDQEAVQSLFEGSLNKGLNGKSLKIRARKGSALPSTMRSFTTESFTAPEA